MSRPQQMPAAVRSGSSTEPPPELSVLGREPSLFADDFDGVWSQLEDVVGGSRVLVIGGAGTIGAATIRRMIPLRPAYVHVVDVSENGLAELVRDLRSRSWEADLPRLQFSPIEYESALMEQLLADEPKGFDHVLNFAALKHVRSAKNAASILRLLRVNVLGLVGLEQAWSRLRLPRPRRWFSVSTDKAADPANVMGASKRLMEAVLFQCISADYRTSARFANVAFSAGSLLDSWHHRLASRQPLAAPADTYRFFVTPDEAGRLCALAAFATPDRTTLIPSEDAALEPMELTRLAERYLEAHGLRPVRLSAEDDARRAAAEWRDERYPLLVTPRDTGGEKPIERFVAEGEAVHPLGMQHVRGLTPPDIDPDALGAFLSDLEGALASRAPVDSRDWVEALSVLIPSLRDRPEARRHLDERM